MLCKFYAQYNLTQQLQRVVNFQLSLFSFFFTWTTFLHLFWMRCSEVCLVGPSSPVWMWSSWRGWWWRLITVNTNSCSHPLRRVQPLLKIRACPLAQLWLSISRWDCCSEMRSCLCCTKRLVLEQSQVCEATWLPALAHEVGPPHTWPRMYIHRPLQDHTIEN